MPPKMIKGNGRGALRLNRQKIIKSLSNGDIRRLGRRGGIRRMGANFHVASKECLITFLFKILSETLIYTKHAYRKTVTINDCHYACKKYGRGVLGYDNQYGR